MQAISKACFSFTHVFFKQIFIVYLIYAKYMLAFKETQNKGVSGFKIKCDVVGIK